MQKYLSRRLAPILAILFLAFVLRSLTLETRPLWYDDAFSVFLAERGPAAIVSGTAADTDPPGYYLLLYIWMQGVGQTPLAMRWLGVALSTLVVAFVYASAARGFGAAVGHWAALLVAWMPFQIYHAQELRMYTLLALGVGIYLYGVLRLALAPESWRFGKPLRGPRFRALALIVVGAVLAMYAQSLAFAALLAGNVYFLLAARRDRRAWRKLWLLIGAQCLAGVAYLPWLFYLPTQLEKIQRAFYTSAPGVLEIVQLMLVSTSYLPLPPLLISGTLFVTMMVLGLAIWRLIKIARRESLPALGVIVAFALAPPLILFVVSYLMRPVFVPRGLIGSALAYAILLGVAAARAPRLAQIALGALVVLAAAALLPFYYSAYGEWRRAPYAQADAFLRQNARADDLILHDNKLAYFPMHLYDRALSQVFLADPPGSDNDTLAPASQAAMQLYPTDFEQAAQGHDRVWFVIYQTAIGEAQALEQAHANLARLDARFRRIQETAYGDLRIFLYTRP